MYLQADSRKTITLGRGHERHGDVAVCTTVAQLISAVKILGRVSGVDFPVEDDEVSEIGWANTNKGGLNNFIGDNDVKTKLKGEKGKKFVFLIFHVSQKRGIGGGGGNAKMPRRNAGGAGGAAGGRGGGNAGNDGRSTSRHHSIIRPEDVANTQAQLSARYRGKYTDKQYNIWATAMCYGECDDSGDSPPTDNAAWKCEEARIVAEKNDIFIPHREGGGRRPDMAGGRRDATSEFGARGRGDRVDLGHNPWGQYGGGFGGANQLFGMGMHGGMMGGMAPGMHGFGGYPMGAMGVGAMGATGFAPVHASNRPKHPGGEIGVQPPPGNEEPPHLRKAVANKDIKKAGVKKLDKVWVVEEAAGRADRKLKFVKRGAGGRLDSYACKPEYFDTYQSTVEVSDSDNTQDVDDSDGEDNDDGENDEQ